MLVLAVFVLGCALALGAARLGAALVAKARAETTADAAALAAADALALGEPPGRAHEAAVQIALDNGGRLVSCGCGARRATVVVEVPVAVLGGWARATARAEVDGP